MTKGEPKPNPSMKRPGGQWSIGKSPALRINGHRTGFDAGPDEQANPGHPGEADRRRDDGTHAAHSPDEHEAHDELRHALAGVARHDVVDTKDRDQPGKQRQEDERNP